MKKEDKLGMLIVIIIYAWIFHISGLNIYLSILVPVGIFFLMFLLLYPEKG